MPYTDNTAECPCCHVRATGRVQIERIFGYRNMGDGRHIPQSYCRRCRSAKCTPTQPRH